MKIFLTIALSKICSCSENMLLKCVFESFPQRGMPTVCICSVLDVVTETLDDDIDGLPLQHPFPTVLLCGGMAGCRRHFSSRPFHPASGSVVPLSTFCGPEEDRLSDDLLEEDRAGLKPDKARRS